MADCPMPSPTATDMGLDETGNFCTLAPPQQPLSAMDMYLALPGITTRPLLRGDFPLRLDLPEPLSMPESHPWIGDIQPPGTPTIGFFSPIAVFTSLVVPINGKSFMVSHKTNCLMPGRMSPLPFEPGVEPAPEPGATWLYRRQPVAKQKGGHARPLFMPSPFLPTCFVMLPSREPPGCTWSSLRARHQCMENMRTASARQGDETAAANPRPGTKRPRSGAGAGRKRTPPTKKQRITPPPEALEDMRPTRKDIKEQIAMYACPWIEITYDFGGGATGVIHGVVIGFMSNNIATIMFPHSTRDAAVWSLPAGELAILRYVRSPLLVQYSNGERWIYGNHALTLTSRDSNWRWL